MLDSDSDESLGSVKQIIDDGSELSQSMKSSTTVVRVGDTSGNNTMNNSMASLSMAGVEDSQRSMAGLSSHGGTVVIHDGDSSDGEPHSRQSSNINSMVPIPEEEEAVEVIQSKADIDDRNDEIRRSR